MQNRHEPQLSTDEYQSLLERYSILLEAFPKIKADAKESKKKIDDESTNLENINPLDPMLALLSYDLTKYLRKGMEHQLIFHSQDAVTKLYDSKSALFASAPSSSSLAQSQNLRNTSKSNDSSSNEDSQEYRSLSMSSTSID